MKIRTKLINFDSGSSNVSQDMDTLSYYINLEKYSHLGKDCKDSLELLPRVCTMKNLQNLHLLTMKTILTILVKYKRQDIILLHLIPINHFGSGAVHSEGS